LLSLSTRLSLKNMRPSALDWSVENCTISRSMAILGEKWTFVVLREVFNGIRRFDDMRERTQIPRQVLANRLASLVTAGVLHRVPYREPGARERAEYRLTTMGFDLYPVLVALLDWGDRYLAGPEGPPLRMVHRECGEPVHTTLTCEAPHPVGTPRDVIPQPGPGAQPRHPYAADAAAR
jgi:DNA-binding HxlR family transcriptional regulator